MFKKMVRMLKVNAIIAVDNYLNKKYPFKVIGWHRSVVQLLFKNESKADQKLLIAMLSKEKRLSLGDYEKLCARGYISKIDLDAIKFARACTERVQRLRTYMDEQTALLLGKSA